MNTSPPIPPYKKERRGRKRRKRGIQSNFFNSFLNWGNEKKRERKGMALMNHPFMPLFSVISPMLQNLSIYTTEICCDGISIHIRNDIGAIPKMNGIANAVSQSIGSVSIIRILNNVVCVAILCSEKSIGIACNKRAILIDRQRIAVIIITVNLIGYTRGFCREAGLAFFRRAHKGALLPDSYKAVITMSKIKSS